MMQGTGYKIATGDQRGQQGGIFALVRLVGKPLRIFQFLVVLLIFTLVIYTVTLGDSKVSSVICLLLIILSGVYVFVLAVDLISQFSGGELHAFPMILLTFLGSVLFGIAVALLISVYSVAAFWYILTTLILSFFICILFILEIAMILVFWKRKYCCKECCPTSIMEVSRGDLCHPACPETVKHDLTTSISHLGIASGDEEGFADHSQRKVGYGRRRQYVDCPTNARSVSAMDIAEVQTESRLTADIHSQTQREMKETLVQTVSKCELCNRQLQVTPTSGAMQTTQQLPCAPCPALVQLIRGVPCCPGCRCVAGIVQMPQQSQQQQTQRQEQLDQPTKEQMQWVQPIDEKSYGMLTSEKAGVDQVSSASVGGKRKRTNGQTTNPKLIGMSGTITKLTVASYCIPQSKKSNALCQTIDADDMKTKKVGEPKKKVSISKKKQEFPPRSPREDLIPEREKAKAINNTKKEPKKQILKKSLDTPAEKETDSPAMVSLTMEIPASIVEDASTISIVESAASGIIKKELKSPEKQAISPSAQVAKIINRLQEIENKSDELGETKDVQDSDVKQDSLSEVKGAQSSQIETTLDTSSEFKVKEIVQSTGSEIKQDTQFNACKNEQVATTESHKTDIKKQSGKSVQIPSTQEQLVHVTHIHTVSDNQYDESKAQSDISEFSLDKLAVSKESSMKFSDTGKDSAHKKRDLKAKDDQSKKVDGAKVEQWMETSSEYQPQMGTQTNYSSRNKKTHVLRKNNKVEPLETTHTETTVQTPRPESSDELNSPSTSKPQSERLFTGEKRVSVEDKNANICSACQRQKYPSLPGPLRYYSIHKDKRGRLYCDFCATANTTQIVDKNDNQKRLKCAGCGNLIRPKVSLDENVVKGSRNNSDNCPKCGQAQTRVHSAPTK